MSKRTKALFDMLFRHQLYVEGVKVAFAANYAALLDKLYKSFTKYMAQVRYTTLDQFTKRELTDFINKFQKDQSNAYDLYTQKLVVKLKEFLAADLDVTETIFADVTGEQPKERSSKLWGSILADPNPANGKLISDEVKLFVGIATGVVLAAVRQGYANAWTAAQTLQVISSLQERLLNQNASMNNTVIQHISSSLQASVASQFYDSYQWVAILDNRTTLICRSRNGTIYIYGQGPLPPAHYNCRSKAVPYDGESHSIPKNYYDWIVDQPAAFQDDVLGTAQANLLRSGKVTARTFTQIHTVKPLTIDEFKSKIKFILGD